MRPVNARVVKNFPGSIYEVVELTFNIPDPMDSTKELMLGVEVPKGEGILWCNGVLHLIPNVKDMSR